MRTDFLPMPAIGARHSQCATSLEFGLDLGGRARWTASRSLPLRSQFRPSMLPCGHWRKRIRIVGGRVEDLVEFARHHKMGTILLDPPWPVEGAVLPYEPINMDDLRNLPVPELAADRCHIHMWATGINCQFAAKEVIEAW